MKGLKKISTFLLLCTLPVWAFCQPEFHLTEDNLKASVIEIQNIYGDQIDLDFTEIYEFLLHYVQNSLPEEECPAPDPQIDSQSDGSIYFSWDSIPQAHYYRTFHLNLSDGSNSSSDTDVPSVAFHNLNRLNAFGFQSNCGGLPYGPVSLIIADVDVLMPGEDPPTGNLCLCTQSYPVKLYDGLGTGNTTWSQNWPSTCGNTQYKLRLRGTKSNNTYSSDLTFVHEKSFFPHMIYLMSYCDNNAQSSSSSPQYVGSANLSNYYNVSFTTAKIDVTVPPNSDLLVEQLVLDVCDCPADGKGGNIEGPGSDGRSGQIELVPSTSLIAYPNPGTDYTELAYELAETSEVSITVYDVLGKSIQEVLPRTMQNKGSHQIQIDLSNWPKGIYSCRLFTPKTQQSISITKN